MATEHAGKDRFDVSVAAAHVLDLLDEVQMRLNAIQGWAERLATDDVKGQQHEPQR